MRASQRAVLGEGGQRDLVTHAAALESAFVQLRDWVEETAATLERRTDTADLADVLLPATMQPEHVDLHDAYGHLYLSWNEPAVTVFRLTLPVSQEI